MGLDNLFFTEKAASKKTTSLDSIMTLLEMAETFEPSTKNLQVGLFGE